MLSLLLYSSESLTSPIPHAAALAAVNGNSSHRSKPPHKGHLFPTAPATDTLTPPTRLPIHEAAHNGSSQAAPLGTGGEVGLKKAENGGGKDVESWERALGFCSQNTLVPLQHHP